MAKETERVPCPECGGEVSFQYYRNPTPTVDVVLQVGGEGVALIRRKNPPYGWALPGGFVDYGESAEQAALRELWEETGAGAQLQGLLGVYSHPDRDPRKHTLSVVFTARVEDASALRAGDDAGELRVFPGESLPELAFDHSLILQDFFRGRPQSGTGIAKGASLCGAGLVS